jgi:hypothetical protein
LRRKRRRVFKWCERNQKAKIMRGLHARVGHSKVRVDGDGMNNRHRTPTIGGESLHNLVRDLLVVRLLEPGDDREWRGSALPSPVSLSHGREAKRNLTPLGTSTSVCAAPPCCTWSQAGPVQTMRMVCAGAVLWQFRTVHELSSAIEAKAFGLSDSCNACEARGTDAVGDAETDSPECRRHRGRRCRIEEFTVAS